MPNCSICYNLLTSKILVLKHSKIESKTSFTLIEREKGEGKYKTRDERNPDKIRGNLTETEPFEVYLYSQNKIHIKFLIVCK